MDFEELRVCMNSYTPVELANKPFYDEENFLPRKFGQRKRKIYTNVQNFDLFFQSTISTCTISWNSCSCMKASVST